MPVANALHCKFAFTSCGIRTFKFTMWKSWSECTAGLPFWVWWLLTTFQTPWPHYFSCLSFLKKTHTPGPDASIIWDHDPCSTVSLSREKHPKKHGRNVVCVNASKQPSAEAVFGKAPKVSWKATWAVINWLSYTISSLTRTCSVHSSWIEKNWLLITVIVYRSIAVLTSCLCDKMWCLYLRITSASTYHRLLSLFSFFNVWSKDGWPKSRDVSPSESCRQAGCVFVLFSLPFFAFARIHWCSLPGWDSYHNTASILK